MSTMKSAGAQVASRVDDSGPMQQPEARPISLCQSLVEEVRRVYACLKIERKRIELDVAQTPEGGQHLTVVESDRTLLADDTFFYDTPFDDTLLDEHGDHSLASQRQQASPGLKPTSYQYAKPAHMWRHRKGTLLEPLRHGFPGFLESILAFVYPAYSILALLRGSASKFKDAWLECLGDLGRYRKAIEDDDMHRGEMWAGVSRDWYTKPSDGSPETERLRLHLAVLAIPAALRQPSYYAKLPRLSKPFLAARRLVTKPFGSATAKVLRNGSGGRTQRDRGPRPEQVIGQVKLLLVLASASASSLARPRCPSAAPSRPDVDGASSDETPACLHTWPAGEAEAWRPSPSFGTRVSLSGRGKKLVMLFTLLLASAVVSAKGPSAAVKWGAGINGIVASATSFAALNLSLGSGVDVKATWLVVTTCLSVGSFMSAIVFVLLLGACLGRDERIAFHVLQFIFTAVMSLSTNNETGSSPKALNWLEYVPFMGLVAATCSFLIVWFLRHAIRPREHDQQV